ncbi:MAG: 50S ribosome-binding GTPase [Planctomycetes bacterium]|nr:50S ribosome-binding GTPase [Planctomycetota bacterium]
MIGDTIVAVATAMGPAARGAIRVSGPGAIAAAGRVFAPALPRARAQVEGHVEVLGHRVATLALVMPGPRSFTGEDVVELHTVGSPLLLRMVLDALLEDGVARGVREALPGEFTARACQNGRLDLAAAEGLLMLLHAQDQRAAAAAVQWLRGGLADAARAVRSTLQDSLALLEFGLDFDDDDGAAAAAARWTAPLGDALATLQRLGASLPTAASGGELLLLGHGNVGKSSLANALAGRDVALVADRPGTTRDLLRVPVVDPENGEVVLWDAPGDLEQPDEVDRAALALRQRLAGRAAALLLVLDAASPRAPEAAFSSTLPWAGVVFTRADLLPRGQAPALPPEVAARCPVDRAFVTSTVTGEGLAALRAALCRSIGGAQVDVGGPLRAALGAAAAAAQRAIAAAADGPEVAAVELRHALLALDGIGGEHTPEHLLDRIYGRFCLGK